MRTNRTLDLMKAILAGLALVLVAERAVGGSLYSFEELAEKRQEVPASVKAALRASVADALADCQKQLGLKDEQMQNYFTSTPVELSGSKARALLVLPTQYCYAFFGAHAVTFWLFLLEPSGPRLVLANAQDALEVQDVSSNGLPNVSTYYGASEIKYQYNGKNYVARPE